MSIVPWTTLNQDMFLPSSSVILKHTCCAEWTFRSSLWLWSYALVSMKVFFENYRFAFGANFILICVKAFFLQVVVECLDFNHLFAFPAGCKHWALLPVVDINTFLIEILIKSSAEVAHLFVIGKLKMLLVLANACRTLALPRRWILLLILLFAELFRRLGSLTATRVDIGDNSLFARTVDVILSAADSSHQVHFTLILINSKIAISFLDCILNSVDLGFS